MMWVFYILAVIGTMMAWNFLHEASHILMTKLVVGAKNVEIHPYLHFSDGSFYWSRSKWSYEKSPTVHQRTAIYMAPRIVDILFITLMAITCLSHSNFAIFWLIFCAGGLVDLLVGSLGIGKNTDLIKTSEILSINPWWIRVFGLIFFTQGLFILLSLLFIL